MTKPSIMDVRSEYSRTRLAELSMRLTEAAAADIPEDLAVFCAGSYARLEASQYSDIDMFFVYGSEEVELGDRRTREIKLFSALIDVAKGMDFPPFSNDAEYLATVRCADVLKHLGSRSDDGLNHFTMRMLMLLESRCIGGQGTFEAVQRDLITAYFRDYPDHQSEFTPLFLMNDIGRFWKTLLLNYEHKRNQVPGEQPSDGQGTDDHVFKNKQKVRNFKLKYSRMTTCFATIAALATYEDNIGEDDLLKLVQLTPQQRLELVVDRMPTVGPEVSAVQNEYAWFLEQTGKTEANLRAGFEDHDQRKAQFDRANAYGDKMYELLHAIEDRSSRPLLRYLVI